MAAFTLEELNLAVEIHQLVKRLNSLVHDAEGLGLDVAFKVDEREEVLELVTPGEIRQLPAAVAVGIELKVMVYKAIAVEAASASEGELPDAVLPHGWMG